MTAENETGPTATTPLSAARETASAAAEADGSDTGIEYGALPEEESGYAGTPLPPVTEPQAHLTGLGGTPFTPIDLAGDGYAPAEDVGGGTSDS